MNTWAYPGITFSLMVIAPLVAPWISSVRKLLSSTPDREPATNVADAIAPVSNADVALAVATVSNAMENHDSGNHLRNGDNLNILNEAVVTPNRDNLNNLNEDVITLNGEQIGQVVVNIEDHDHEEFGV